MKIISIFMLTFILFVAIAIVFADKDDDDDDDDDKEIYFLFLDKRSSSPLNEQKRDNETCSNQEKRFPPNQSAINRSEDSNRHFDHKRDLPTHSESYRNLANRQIRDAKTVPYYSYKRETTPYNYCRRNSDPLTNHYHKRDISSER